MSWSFRVIVCQSGTEACDLNLQSDFKFNLKMWLCCCWKHDNVTLVDSLGPLIGDRFWGQLKNTVLLYSLLSSVVEFMLDRVYIVQVQSKVENNLAAMIRNLTCLFIKDGRLRHQQ